MVGQSGCDPGVAPPRCDRTRLTQRLSAGRPRPARQRVKVGGGGARRERAIAAGSPENSARPTPLFTTAFFFYYKKNRWQNEQRTEHASFTRRTKRNTERSFIYTVLCTDMVPNNFFFLKKCIYGRSGVFFLRVDESAGRLEWENNAGTSRLFRYSCKNKTRRRNGRFHRLLAVPFFPRFLSQFACVKYQKETIILQRQKKNNQQNNNKTVLSQKEEKNWKETRNIERSHVRVGFVSQIQAGNQKAGSHSGGK